MVPARELEWVARLCAARGGDIGSRAQGHRYETSQKGRTIPTRLAHGLLVFFAILAGWALTEGAARRLLGPPPYFGDRVVLFSDPSWRHARYGTLRYAPDSQVREVAVYGEKIEYDVAFETNNLGFIDTRDYHKHEDADGRQRIAFVGDSMTAGYHGGQPWVPQLRDAVERKDSSIEIYNLGVGGVGIPQFYRLLESVESEIDFERIVVLFITHDLFRRRVNMVQDAGLVYICPVGVSRAKCLSVETRMMVMPDRDANPAEILELIRERGFASNPSGCGDWIARNTRLGYFLARDEGALSSFDETAKALGEQFRDLPLFVEFKRRFPEKRIDFVHLPMKEETIRGRYYLDVAADVRKAGLGYVSMLERCDLESSDYHEVDAHPNQMGYEKIRRCVGRELGLL